MLPCVNHLHNREQFVAKRLDQNSPEGGRARYGCVPSGSKFLQPFFTIHNTRFDQQLFKLCRILLVIDAREELAHRPLQQAVQPTAKEAEPAEHSGEQDRLRHT